MNELARMIDNYIIDKKISYAYIAGRLNVRRQHIYNILRKKNFTIEDANFLLSAIDKKLLIKYSIIDSNIDINIL